MWLPYLPATDNLSGAIDTGVQIALIGPGGSGKTTLLSLLGALERPDSGRISILGEEINRLNESVAADFRRHQIGFIFQDDALMPELTVAENVVLPLIFLKVKAGEIKRRIGEILTDLNLL